MASVFTESDYSAMKDEQLVFAAQSGDDRALNFLAKRMLPLAFAYASRYNALSVYREDFAQEGMFGLLAAVRTYSPNKSASFKTYAGVCIRNAIISASKLPKYAAGCLSNLPLYEESAFSSALNPEDMLIADEKLKALRKFLDDKLSDFERNVVYLYLEGYTYDQISATLSTHVKAVDNALQRIRRKLKELS